MTDNEKRGVGCGFFIVLMVVGGLIGLLSPSTPSEPAANPGQQACAVWYEYITEGGPLAMLGYHAERSNDADIRRNVLVIANYFNPKVTQRYTQQQATAALEDLTAVCKARGWWHA